MWARGRGVPMRPTGGHGLWGPLPHDGLLAPARSPPRPRYPVSAASSRLRPSRDLKMYSLGQSGRGSAASRRGLGFFACRGYLRAFAPGVSLPLPPAPSPRAGGGRAQGRTRCALATLRLAPSPALPSAFAAAHYASGRNAPRAGMRAPACGLRAQTRHPPPTALRARHFCLPRVFAPFGYVCPAAFNRLWVPYSLSISWSCGYFAALRRQGC